MSGLKELGRIAMAAAIAVPAADLFVATREAVAQPSREVIEVTRTDGGRTVTLKPEIYWPSGTGPFGIVVVVNSSSGAQDIFLALTVVPMNRAGIAVAVLDAFTPRSVSSTAVDQTQVSSSQMALDALHVADVLRRDQRVKQGKIALQGHSKGGVTALHAATAEWHSFMGSSLKPFDAVVSFSPSCELQFRDPKLASPLLVMLGEKDDATVPGPCVKLFERMKAAGQEIAWEVVPGVEYTWDASRLHDVQCAGLCRDPTLLYARRVRAFNRRQDHPVLRHSSPV